jgi:predicted RNase H-like HicB family nuclease
MKKYQKFEINYFQDEDGIFTAIIPAIRGCVASGRTLEEAYLNAADAIESCLEARKQVVALQPRKVKYDGLNIYRRLVHAYKSFFHAFMRTSVETTSGITDPGYNYSL